MTVFIKTSPLSGKKNSMDIPVSEERVRAWMKSDELVQNAFPELTADQREFLLTGILPDEWDELFEEADDGYNN